MVMKSMFVAAAAMLAVVGLSSGPSEAAGCVKGAVIGGVAGHFVGHHGLLGAGAGCAIGHHEAYRRDQERGRSDRAWYDDRGNTTGYGSSLERGSGYPR
jgi:hypothetical protein